MQDNFWRCDLAVSEVGKGLSALFKITMFGPIQWAELSAKDRLSRVAKIFRRIGIGANDCLLYTSDAADE